jgi:hypothetical protein
MLQIFWGRRSRLEGFSRTVVVKREHVALEVEGSKVPAAANALKPSLGLFTAVLSVVGVGKRDLAVAIMLGVC